MITLCERSEASAPASFAAPSCRIAPLQALADESLSLRLSAWRGRSGRRYVVSVYQLDGEAEPAYAGALLLAVERSGGGRRLISACESGALGMTGVNGAWLAAMRRRGANELHVHLLAATREGRRETLHDLEF